jgi:hypothetical protein
VNFMAIVDRRHIISTVLFIFIFNRILNLSFVYFYLFIYYFFNSFQSMSMHFDLSVLF